MQDIGNSNAFFQNPDSMIACKAMPKSNSTPKHVQSFAREDLNFRVMKKNHHPLV
jgi:hypothetical protein